MVCFYFRLGNRKSRAKRFEMEMEKLKKRTKKED